MNERKKPKKVVIVGAGPSGLLLANYLVRREGYQIVVVEKRPDPRIVAQSDPQLVRSFPMALNSRGLSSLGGIPGLKEAVALVGVYISFICLHNARAYKPRVMKRDTPSLSVDRNRLTLTLLEVLVGTSPASNTTLSVQFDSALHETNIEEGWISVIQQDGTDVVDGDGMDKKVIRFDHLVAADGGYSRVRRHLVKSGKLNSMEKEIPDDYRTIFLSLQSKDGTVTLDKDKMHGWMLWNNKHNIKIITVPVHVGCTSGVIVFDKGQDPFVGMTSTQEVKEYFERLCPSSLAKVVTDKEAAELLARPTSTTLSVRCTSLHVEDKVLILGDAGHAVSASAGQGCNSSLQDVEVFHRLLDSHHDDWTKALPAYTAERLQDAHAVSDLSDYCTPRTPWMKAEWMTRMVLRKVLPKWLGNLLLRPMPMELLMETSLPYSEVLRQTQWWIDRVKASFKHAVRSK